ncbi:MAG TPA: peroxide stress protein YaaA, partial [Epsilonproteobacteria bacterium]|nr:peroxide stress protein YaaA [Campylobacterota bacterium]
MIILLAPSETKKAGGEAPFLLQSLLFEALLPDRTKLLHTYINILQRGAMAELSKMFGLKKEADIEAHQKDIIHEPAMKAIQRYTGVAFDHLGYERLDKDTQSYIDTHVILFSNLFGVLRASDMIPA